MTPYSAQKQGKRGILNLTELQDKYFHDDFLGIVFSVASDVEEDAELDSPEISLFPLLNAVLIGTTLNLSAFPIDSLPHQTLIKMFPPIQFFISLFWRHLLELGF